MWRRPCPRSTMLAATLCFSLQNPNHGSGNRKSCRSSSSPAYFYLSIVRYQDRISASGPSPFPRFVLFFRMGAQRSTCRIFLPHLVTSMEEVEEIYVMVKPDGVQRGLVGDIISRFEKKGFLLKGLKLLQCPKELAELRMGGKYRAYKVQEFGIPQQRREANEMLARWSNLVKCTAGEHLVLFLYAFPSQI